MHKLNVNIYQHLFKVLFQYFNMGLHNIFLIEMDQLLVDVEPWLKDLAEL